MNITELSPFTQTLAKTKEWLEDVQEELHLDEPHDAYVSLRAVLHMLRDRLTVEEAADLGAQLPMIVRGFYYEGWSPAGKPVKIRSEDDFLEGVEEELQRDVMDARGVTLGVFRMLQRRISMGELNDIKSTLPKSLLTLWPETE